MTGDAKINNIPDFSTQAARAQMDARMLETKANPGDKSFEVMLSTSLSKEDRMKLVRNLTGALNDLNTDVNNRHSFALVNDGGKESFEIGGVNDPAQFKASFNQAMQKYNTAQSATGLPVTNGAQAAWAIS